MTDPGVMDCGPEKPLLGQACNGCGYCCAAEPCGIAKEYLPFHVTTPCPAMEFEDGRFHCGMVRHPSRHMSLQDDRADGLLGPLFAQLLGVGSGCDAEDPESLVSLCDAAAEPDATCLDPGEVVSAI